MPDGLIEIRITDAGIQIGTSPGLTADAIQRALYGALTHVEQQMLVAKLAALVSPPRVALPNGRVPGL